jgi:hypothetical protein
MRLVQNEDTNMRCIMKLIEEKKWGFCINVRRRGLHIGGLIKIGTLSE